MNPKRVEQFLSCLTVAVYVVIATYGAFSGGVWGGVGIGFGLILYLGTAYLDRRWPRPPRDFAILAGVSLLIMALLNLGSVDAHISWYDWKRLVTIFVPLLLLSAPELPRRAAHKYFFVALTMGCFIGAFALGVELMLDAPVLHLTQGDIVGITRYNRGMSYLIILALPVMAALWTGALTQRHVVTSDDGANQMPFPFAAEAPKRRRNWREVILHYMPSADRVIPFGLFVAMMLFPTGLTESRASKLAFIVALGTLLAAKIAPVFVRWALGVLTVVLVSWPIIVQKCFVLFQDRLEHLPRSWRARVEIWDYMSYRIFEHPWFGWGLGTSKILDFKNPHGSLYVMVLDNAPHPHNVVTQLWVELGLPGLVLGLAFAFLTLRQAGRLSASLAPFALGAWAGALCLALVAYNVWTDSMFAAFALTGFAFVLLDRYLAGKIR